MDDKTKTLADVADHAIDKLSGGAAEIARAVKQVAPHAWEVAVRRQVICGFTDLALQLMAVACVLWLVSLSRKTLAARGGRLWDTENDCPTAAIWPCLASAIAALIVGIWVADTLPRPINRILAPEYYAAVDLLDDLK